MLLRILLVLRPLLLRLGEWISLILGYRRRSLLRRRDVARLPSRLNVLLRRRDVLLVYMLLLLLMMMRWLILLLIHHVLSPRRLLLLPNIRWRCILRGSWLHLVSAIRLSRCIV